MKKIKYFKLNEDDILEIVSETIAEKTGIREFFTKSQLFGTPSEDLRIIIAVSDSSLSNIDLNYIDKEIDFNGDHCNATELSDDQMITALDRMIKSGEF